MKHVPKSGTAELPIPLFEEALENSRREDVDFDRDKWIYLPCAYDEYRYILGTVGKKPLICIGVNPSTASPGALDPTLKSVERIARANGYDSFLMFNLYAQRATDPDSMEKEMNPVLHEQNMAAFRWALRQIEGTPDVWAAWGTVIEKRGYLRVCAAEMAEEGKRYGVRWHTCGKRSKKGHPHHPLYLKNGSPLEDFDMDCYIAALDTAGEN